MVRPREWIYEQQRPTQQQYSTEDKIKEKKASSAAAAKQVNRIAAPCKRVRFDEEHVTFGIGNKYPPITCRLPTDTSQFLNHNCPMGGAKVPRGGTDMWGFGTTESRWPSGADYEEDMTSVICKTEGNRRQTKLSLMNGRKR